jgi:uncharacterized protein YcfL
MKYDIGEGVKHTLFEHSFSMSLSKPLFLAHSADGIGSGTTNASIQFWNNKEKKTDIAYIMYWYK